MQNYKIKWDIKALESFNHYIAWYEDNAGIEIANKFIGFIEVCQESIRSNPYIARPAFEIEELREYVVHKYPFLISYYIKDDIIAITSFLHQSKNK